jgi:tetratricopeptide (TPR) repeat protein
MRQFERMRDALHAELGVGPDPNSVALYEEILDLEGREPATPAERTGTLLAQGLVALNRKELPAAKRAASEARAIAVEDGLGRELGEASALLGMVAHAQGRWRELFRDEFEAAISEAPDLAVFVFDAHLCLAEFSLHGPDAHHDVSAFAEELLAVAERAGPLHGRALATLMLGEASLLSGQVSIAESQLSRAVELHAMAGAQGGRALCIQRLAEATLAAGRRSSARRLLEDAFKLAEGSSLTAHLVVRLCGTKVEAAADPAAAADAARWAHGVLADMEVCEPCSMGYLVTAAVALARVGDIEESRHQLEQAERISGMWQGGPWIAAVWEARGALRRAEGDPTRAAALFREAADLFGREGRPLDEARCRAAVDLA